MVLHPRDGVYAVIARVLGAEGERTILHGIANLGTRPTLGAGRYGLVIVPALVLAAGTARWPFDTAPENPDD